MYWRFDSKEQNETHKTRMIDMQASPMGERTYYVVGLYDDHGDFLFCLPRGYNPQPWTAALKWKSAEKAHEYILGQKAKFGGWDNMHQKVAFNPAYVQVKWENYKVLKIVTKGTVEETE